MYGARLVVYFTKWVGCLPGIYGARLVVYLIRWVQCSPDKHRDLDLIPSTSKTVYRGTHL